MSKYRLGKRAANLDFSQSGRVWAGWEKQMEICSAVRHTESAGGGPPRTPDIEQQPGLVPNEIDYLWPMFTLAGCFVCSLPCFFIFLLFHFLYPFHSSNTQFIQYVLFPGHYAELHGDVEMPQM